ncbi:neutral ceramidase-like [Tribolium madens]|uniref:neutral ceramidase-like n=1 Tax=Tribolium madens TaxID=41895 RepID=UPI001CF73EAD|nr:neutral ceramidase-like [Tribolium madens]XP_044261928.1 neutral ceramidase-like [Tribolium madens]
MRKKLLALLWIITLSTCLRTALGVYKIGVGIADCTGPAAEVTFIGYGKSNQKGCGIHLRQFSRAFVIDDGSQRVAFVSVDAGMMGYGVRKAVISRLQKQYKDTYTESNLILSGTHTHSAPGGFLMDFLYDIPSLGYVKETFEALVDGITRSVVRAHENMVDGKIFISTGELTGANINRSPTSYLLNPEEERDRYKYDVDKEMVQLQLVNSAKSTIGVISWFPVHPTSMNNTNCLISSDNVGYASVLMEKFLNKNSLVGQGRIVAAFASTNLGDVSPNIKGPRCLTTGEECDVVSSTCDGQAKLCVAAGPGDNMFESTKIIAEKLFEQSKILLQSANAKEVTGPVRHIHQYVDMPTQNVTIALPNGTITHVTGCLPAMGYSFAAGTTDGVGELGFAQGTKSTNSYWNTLRDLLFKATEEDIRCQHPKPILINSGRISIPYQWQPRIVSTQIVQVGEVLLIAVPGEFTTMSGRRLRNSVQEAAISNGASPDTKAIITGLSNVYTSYITTPEEYQMQRYEGASTIYGPHTLTIYIEKYKELIRALLKEEKLDSGPLPVDLSHKVISLQPGVVFDTPGLIHHFGDCLLQPPTRTRVRSKVRVKFVSGHPRNNLMNEKTFLTVEKLTDGDKWIIVATDADWETKFIWTRTSTLIGGSEATIEWEIPYDATSGLYRIHHFGYFQHIFGGVHPYSGVTNTFQVIQ